MKSLASGRIGSAGHAFVSASTRAAAKICLMIVSPRSRRDVFVSGRSRHWYRICTESLHAPRFAAPPQREANEERRTEKGEPRMKSHVVTGFSHSPFSVLGSPFLICFSRRFV